MAQQVINVGTVANDGTGDNIRVSFGKVYSNFTELYTFNADYGAFGLSFRTSVAASDGRTALGLGTIATQASSGVSITGGSITGITDIAIADGGTGASSASGARTNLALGTISTQDAASVSITGGSVTGITDLAVADGGTGASTASAAQINLGVDVLFVAKATTVPTNGGATTIANSTSLEYREYFNFTGTIASHTVNLPSSPVDQQRIHLLFRGAITSISISGGAVTVLGPPASIAAPSRFAFIYDQTSNFWWRSE